MSEPTDGKTPEELRQEILARLLVQKIKTAELDPTATWYDDINLAAIEALSRVPNSLEEHAGVIFRNKDGKFAYSIPVTNKSHDKFLFQVNSSPELRLAAVYHSHPPGAPDQELFSDADVDMAKKLKVLSFIKILQSGEIRRFDPATSKTRPLNAREFTRKVSEGERVEVPEGFLTKNFPSG